MLTLTREELQFDYLTTIGRTTADPGVLAIEECSDRRIVARVRFDESNIRPGGVISGPALFTAVDSMGYLVTLSRSPRGSNGFTSALAMQFLRPAPIGTLRVEGRLLKFSARSSVVDTLIYCESVEEPVVHAVVTYVPVFPRT